MATKKETKETIDLIEFKPMDLGTAAFRLHGTSPLIVHAWGDKAKQEILDKQQKRAKAGKDIRLPLLEYVSGLYLLDKDGQAIRELPDEFNTINLSTKYEDVQEMLKKYKFGFPTVAIKNSMVSTAYQQGLVSKKTTVKGAIRVMGEMMEIHGFPVMREDMVKIGGMTKTADLRYRPMFEHWYIDILIQFIRTSVSVDQIYAFLQYAGFADGLGEWRTSRDGGFGLFEPENLPLA